MNEMPPARLVVVPIIRDEQGSVLLCRMAADRGVFPGQWALPGGGVEAGERIDEALRREVREELGIEVTDVKALFFKDLLHEKTFPGGEKRLIYMVFLLFECRVSSTDLTLNAEFCEYAWVAPEMLNAYDLNPTTAETFLTMGLFQPAPEPAGSQAPLQA
jgi:nucleoside triphosphatase